VTLPGSQVLAAAEAEQPLLEAFLSLLEREERALVDGDADAVATLAHEKAGCLDRLTRFVLAPAPSPTVRQLRESARAANDRNGRLIAMRLARVCERLELLTGQEEAGPAYGADGYARPGAPVPRRGHFVG
jgi:flagellar biosynthesis/type III secretory pathway chaperone